MTSNGCIHPGCVVPAHRCIAHHIRAWNHGGPTDLPNLVLVCRYHHRRIHHGHLHITQTPTGTYTTTNRAPPDTLAFSAEIAGSIAKVRKNAMTSVLIGPRALSRDNTMMAVPSPTQITRQIVCRIRGQPSSVRCPRGVRQG